MTRRAYSFSSSRPTITTMSAVLVLILLLLVVGMVTLYSNQILYYDKWSVTSDDANNHIYQDNSNFTSSSRRRRDVTGTTASTTVLLTRTSQLSSLLSNLDASDVIECYIVTRMANLANVETSSSSSSSAMGKGGTGGGKRRDIQTIEIEDDPTSAASTSSSSSSSSSIPTGPILVRKAALAFRYRPKVASALHVTSGTATTATTTSPNKESSSSSLDQQKYFELTLEYGPQRAGASKTSESMPMVHVDMEVLASYYEGGNNDYNKNNNIGKYVSWDNQGSIYYSTHISNEWSSAYYMSSITGVVLEKILEKAVEYPSRRPRYQPFEVVSIPSNTIILKSSGPDDFVWDMFRDLADLYVDIDPILVPPRGKVQFYVADPIIEDNSGSSNSNSDEVNNVGGTTTSSEVVEIKPKRLPNPNVKRVKGALESSKAAVFYENFFNCANAKKTGDYSMYVPLVSTLAPSPVPPTIDEGKIVSNTTDIFDDKSDGHGSLRRFLDDASNFTVATSQSSSLHLLDEVGDVKGDENSPDSSHVGDVTSSNTADDEDGSISAPLINDDVEGDTGTMEPDEGSVDSEDDGDVAKAAEKAAIEAAQKAETAAAVAATNSSSPEDSAKAASEAAIAAKKAADASVASRAKLSAEGLLSGDGTMMTSILSSCFSDPKYGIRKMNTYIGASELNDSEHSTQITSTYAYVYLDGDVFIRLNLTAPYWGVSTVLQTVPPPHAHVDGQGDVVDWAIFILLIGVTVFGFIVVIHQLGIVIDKRLQFRHIFHPLADDDSAEMEQLERGGGIAHSIGIDAIPVSLGGRLSHFQDSQSDGPLNSCKDRLSESSIDNEINDERNGLLAPHIELANRENIVTVKSPRVTTPTMSDLPISLRLKEEAPDLVERPTLKSMSKVALPHSSPENNQERHWPHMDMEEKNVPILPHMI